MGNHASSTSSTHTSASKVRKKATDDGTILNVTSFDSFIAGNNINFVEYPRFVDNNIDNLCKKLVVLGGYQKGDTKFKELLIDTKSNNFACYEINSLYKKQNADLKQIGFDCASHLFAFCLKTRFIIVFNLILGFYNVYDTYQDCWLITTKIKEFKHKNSLSIKSKNFDDPNWQFNVEKDLWQRNAMYFNFLELGQTHLYVNKLLLVTNSLLFLSSKTSIRVFDLSNILHPIPILLSSKQPNDVATKQNNTSFFDIADIIFKKETNKEADIIIHEMNLISYEYNCETCMHLIELIIYFGEAKYGGSYPLAKVLFEIKQTSFTSSDSNASINNNFLDSSESEKFGLLNNEENSGTNGKEIEFTVESVKCTKLDKLKPVRRANFSEATVHIITQECFRNTKNETIMIAIGESRYYDKKTKNLSLPDSTSLFLFNLNTCRMSMIPKV